MTMLPIFARTALFPAPSTAFLSTLIEDTATHEAVAFQSDYARRSGYALGPNGEWVTEVRPELAVYAD